MEKRRSHDISGEQCITDWCHSGSPWQHLLPDNLLLEVFWFLGARDLISASETCQSWWRVAQDDFLWRDLLYKKCGITDVALPPGKDSWKSEYKRICYSTPCVASEVLNGHMDEVYHVAFSPSGQMFSTVGRDGTVQIWKLGFDTTLYGYLHLKHLKQLRGDPNGSEYTRFSEFNESETLILIAGLVGQSFWLNKGLIVVASVSSEPRILYMVETHFTNYRGAWIDDTSFLNATIVTEGYYGHKVIFKKHQVDISSKPINLKKKSYEYVVGVASKRGEVVMQLNNQDSDNRGFVRVLDCQRMRKLLSDVQETNKYEKMPQSKLCDEKGDNFSSQNSENGKVGTEHIEDGVPDIEQFKKAMSDEKLKNIVMMVEDSDNENYPRAINDVVFYNLPSKIEFEETKCDDEDSDGKDSDGKDSDDKDSDGKDGDGKDSDGKDSDDESNIGDRSESKTASPIHRICSEGGITGMCLSHDQRYLIYNYRKLIQDSSRYDEKMEVRIYDLLLACDTGMCYRGHKAEQTRSGLSYIFPSSSTDYIACGSETTKAFIWDRHYGNVLATVEHLDGTNSNSVNAVAFNPRDQEVLVTVGDDFKVMVWRSKQRMKELAETNETTGEIQGKTRSISNRNSDTDEFVEASFSGFRLYTKASAGKTDRNKSRDTEEDDDEIEPHVSCCFHKRNLGKRKH